VGKSTIAALLIRWLNELGVKSVLAVDADANTNLPDLLGVKVENTIGSIREELKDKVQDLPGGITKQQFFEYKIHQALVETPGFDLIAMGRPEGPGCYCYSNNLLRDILKTISDQYQYIVIDNEAGMEHLSRRTVQEIDLLLIVSDPSVRGVQTAGRLSRLLRELDTRVQSKYLLINRVTGQLAAAVEQQAEIEGLLIAAILPDDEAVRINDGNGYCIFDLPKDSKIVVSLNDLFNDIDLLRAVDPLRSTAY